MRIIQNLDEMTETARGWLAGGSVGFVPTSGHLHAGHRSLVQVARHECEISAASIFVNPFQYKPGQVPALPPQELARDLQLLDNERVDIVFVPRAEDIYPSHFATSVTPAGVLAERLERANRLDYARGVATITTKLFQLVRPDIGYFSQKNGLRIAMVHQVVRDLNIDISLRILPTVRENDGLAISRRNQLLAPAERQAAPLLYSALLAAKALVDKGERNVATLEKAMADVVAASPLLKLDYAVVCDPHTFEQPGKLLPNPLPDTLFFIGAQVGNTYLADSITWMREGYWLT